MDMFTASNGVEVRKNAAWIAVGEFGQRMELAEIQALREFFQAARDEELGLWRSKSHPGWTAVRRNTVAYFQHEDHERSFHVVVGNKTSLNSWSWDLVEVAREYLEAHPERKDWGVRMPGEAWDIDVPSGGVRAVTVYSARHDEPIIVFRDAFTQVEYEEDDPTIRDARRIFPESD